MTSTLSAASTSTSLPPLGPHNSVSINDPRDVWLYSPSIPASILFTVLFGLLTVAHIVQGFLYRKTFSWVIAMSAFWQTLAYIFRDLSALDQINQGYYIGMQVLVLLAPLWTNAYCYMTFGRMIQFYTTDKKTVGIRARRFTALLVILDIIAFIVQSSGASLASNTGNDSDSQNLIEIGLHMYMGGIGLQQFFIVVFAVLVILFHRRKHFELEPVRSTSWRPLVYTLYAVLCLITIRIIFRLNEFAKGYVNSITTHEAFFYCFDTLPMFFAILLFNIIHPGKYLVGPESDFALEKAELKAIKKAKKEEKKRAKTARKNGDVYTKESRDNSVEAMEMV